jgi:hypothetical protein
LFKLVLTSKLSYCPRAHRYSIVTL